MQKKEVKLLALDMDGTLYNSNGVITEASKQAIREASQKGVCVVLATGREYRGISFEQLQDVSIPYVITTNGSSIYRTSDQICMVETCLPQKNLLSVIEFLMRQEIYITVFIEGKNFTPTESFAYTYKLGLPDYIVHDFEDTRTELKDLVGYVKSGQAKIQKITLNFQRQEDGTLLNREKVYEYLKNCKDICLVNGGYDNLEFTEKHANKGRGLLKLAQMLGIDPGETAAIGDSGNDVEMLRAAAVGIAMGNAPQDIKQQADWITRTNDEDGVAYAIYQLLEKGCRNRSCKRIS